MKIKFKVIYGILLVDAQIDGVKGVVAFDTGSANSVLSSKYFGKNDEHKVAQPAVDSTDGKARVEIRNKIGNYISNDYLFGGYLLDLNSFPLLDMTYVEIPLKTADSELCFLGTIGMNFIKKHVVSVDYINNVIVIDEEVELANPVKFSLSSTGMICIPVTISDKEYIFYVDTGASRGLIDESLKESFMDKEKEEGKGCFWSTKFKAFNMEYEGQMFGYIDFTRLSDDGKVSGIIGSPCLNNKVLTIDCANNLLYLK